MLLKKYILITGAASGIGKAMSEAFIKYDDFHVIMVDYNESALRITKNNISKLTAEKNFSTYVCDVGQTSDVKVLLENLASEEMTPSILINNAGYGGPFQQISEISADEWEKVINTNLKSIYNFCHKLLPIMRDNKFGRIINIASIQGLIGANLSSTYIASKHGVIGYTKAIAAEWGKYGINCNAICPGYVDTKMGAQDDKIANHQQNIISRIPNGRIATTRDITNLTEFLISDKADYINGSIVTIDGGLLADIGIT